MPEKGFVQGQAGISVPDVYDVVGDQAPIVRLSSEEPQYVHDLASTIFSERLSTTVRRSTTGALAASIAWNILITDLPDVPSRILGIQVISDVSARTNLVTVSARDPVADREFPLWAWANAADIFADARVADEAAVTTMELLVPTQSSQLQAPSLLLGGDQPQAVPDISFRGVTSAFGAGTVTHTLLLYLAFAQVGGVSSYGLPVPGW